MSFRSERKVVQTEPKPAGRNRKKLTLAMILLSILIVGVGYASVRVYYYFQDKYAGTNLTISATPNPSQAGMNVDVRGRLTNGLGIGLEDYNVTIESSPDGVHWSELAGPFLTQPSSEIGQQAGTWYVQGGWNFSSTIFLRAVFGGYGSYSPSISPVLNEIVNTLSLSQYWGTFYYPWYCNASCPSPDTWRHWNGCPCTNPSSPYNPPSTWESHFLPSDGSGTFNPASELYSSLSTTVINRDLTWMDYARLNFALVSWWGQNSFEDNAFRLMLAQAQNNATLHLKLAAYYELEGPSFPEATVDQIVDNLTYIFQSRANFTSYFTIGPKHLPVVFVYGDSSDTLNYTERWSTARSIMSAKGESMFIDLKVFPNFTQSGNDKLVDGWHQYGPDVRYEVQSGYSAFASPGYWKYNSTATLNRNATAFASAVAGMASLNTSEAQFLLMETFNEWHEGTQVEPGIPVSMGASSFTQTGPSYGLNYLDIIRNRGQTV
jgi:glycoprotein endo-alpha-1,2-mannosidase